MMANLVKSVLDNGGSIHPLIIPSAETNGTGLMNPSIFNDKGRLICVLRHVNYTLMHCEGNQVFGNRHGPLAYLNPENDVKLKTINYMLELNDDLTIKNNFSKAITFNPSFGTFSMNCQINSLVAIMKEADIESKTIRESIESIYRFDAPNMVKIQTFTARTILSSMVNLQCPRSESVK